jgi:hypothetical protein
MCSCVVNDLVFAGGFSCKTEKLDSVDASIAAIDFMRKDQAILQMPQASINISHIRSLDPDSRTVHKVYHLVTADIQKTIIFVDYFKEQQ